MGRTSALGVVLLCGLAFTATAHARDRGPSAEDEAAWEAERVKLVERLAEGKDEEAALAAWQALVARRDAQVPTSARARREHRQRVLEQRARREAWQRTVDHEVSWRCALSHDPLQPRPTDRWKGDWGPVTRREVVTLPPKDALTEGQTLTLYEVKGQKRTYRFIGEGFGPMSQRQSQSGKAGNARTVEFEAEPGELVLVCDGGTDTDRRLPPEWQQNLQRAGFAARLNAPPRVAQKGKWNPIHITSNPIFWAIKDVRWRYPEDAYVLAALDVVADLGGGRFEIDTLQDQTFILEVPPSLPRRELLVPGHHVWVIMGRPRFDPQLRKLVLTAEDLEPSYIDAPTTNDDSLR